MPRKMTQEEFIKKYSQRFPLLDFSKSIYKNNKTKFILTCPKHGDFKINTSRLNQSVHGCSQCADEKRPEAIKNTMLELYGVENCMQLDSTKQKLRNTILENYGDKTSYAYLELIKRSGETRRISTLKNVYGLTDEQICNINDVEYLKRLHHIEKLNFKEIAEHFGVSWDIIQTTFARLGIPAVQHQTSNFHKSVLQFLDELGVSYKINDREILEGKEADILIEEKKLLIECNGIYFHCEDNNQKAKKLHLLKTEIAEKNGYQLIHLWEDSWHNNTDVFKSFFKNKLGFNNTKIDARKSTIDLCISKKELTHFLNTNHIQGYGNGRYISLGLRYNKNLVAVMCFRKCPKNIKKYGNPSDVYELVRFATNGNVRGGFSKLLKHFIKEKCPSKIYSFGDRETVSSINNVYISNGFKQLCIIPQDYKYAKSGNSPFRSDKRNYRKEAFKKMGLCIEGKTEEILRKEAGLLKCWDVGKICYILDC